MCVIEKVEKHVANTCIASVCLENSHEFKT